MSWCSVVAVDACMFVLAVVNQLLGSTWSSWVDDVSHSSDAISQLRLPMSFERFACSFVTERVC